MKNLILLLVFSILCSCSKTPKPFNKVIDPSLFIYLKNSTGDNLLNTANYNSDNFRIYNEINGLVIEVNNPMSDHPRGFSIINDVNPICMGLSLNTTETELFPITYIKWNDTDTDTLKASYVRTENIIQCNGVWLNGVLVWDFNTPQPQGNIGRSITIVK